MELQNPNLCLQAFVHVIYITFLLWVSVLLPTISTSTATATFSNVTDRLALLQFRKEIKSDPHDVLSSWNDSIPFCKWSGITCGHKHQRVTELNLLGLGLIGTISPYLGNLTFLRFIVLANNTFEGTIPTQLINCSKLRLIDFSRNHLYGTIPKQIGHLKNLVQLYLGVNNITGTIPTSIGNLTSLLYLNVQYNNLVGSIPDDVGRLKSLIRFSVGANKLSGTIPSSLYNISTLTAIYISDNRLEGFLPTDIGLKLPNLVYFSVGENQLSGSIPPSISNASKLQLLELGGNNFTGKPPSNLGKLVDLRLLNFGDNHLGSNSSNDLDWLTSLTNCSQLKILDLHINQFGGILPISISNLSIQLEEIYLNYNYLHGTISNVFEKYNNLVVLHLLGNNLRGNIPSYFGKFEKLRVLVVSSNKLSGPIPSSLGNLTNLFFLAMSANMLQGKIPPSIGNCKHLQKIFITHNNLTGVIPEELINLLSLSLLSLSLSYNSLTGNLSTKLGNLKSLYSMALSDNNLSGEIPTTIGDCTSLENLYLENNHFEGNIPSSLASLKGLVYLDLSRNNLSGNIPKQLVTLTFLQYFNVSFNNLEGEVPSSGVVFQNTSVIILMGNPKLCGGFKKLKLPSCSMNTSRKGLSRRALKLIIIVICTISFSALLLCSIAVYYWKHRSKNKSSSNLNLELDPYSNFPRVSYDMLYKSTEGFSPNNLIGSGSFGSVYKGVIGNEGLVAIKVLKLDQLTAWKSFLIEGKVLRNIRHRNLVSVITSCSSIDYSGVDFKALVLKFMENGSLEEWLHQRHDSSQYLSLIQRLNIAIDVASALHYLHNECEPPIVHCDLKPSNVLLDHDMIAHVSDFGLARLLHVDTDSISQNQSSTIGLKGSIGYMAPEYGMGSEASIQGDTYSYGILLLEMFTGKRPTNEIFEQGFSIHQFIKTTLPEKLMEIVDPSLQIDVVEAHTKTIISSSEPRLVMTNACVQKSLKSLLSIGLACSVDSPQERMNMRNVIRELYSVKKELL